MCGDTQGIHPRKRGVSGKIYVKVEDWSKGLEKKNVRSSVEEHKLQMHKKYITIYL